MTPNEARRIFDETTGMKSIFSSIKNAAEAGRKFTRYDYDALNAHQVDRLRQLGYEVVVEHGRWRIDF